MVAAARRGPGSSDRQLSIRRRRPQRIPGSRERVRRLCRRRSITGCRSCPETTIPRRSRRTRPRWPARIKMARASRQSAATSSDRRSRSCMAVVRTDANLRSLREARRRDGGGARSSILPPSIRLIRRRRRWPPFRRCCSTRCPSCLRASNTASWATIDAARHEGESHRRFHQQRCPDRSEDEIAMRTRHLAYCSVVLAAAVACAMGPMAAQSAAPARLRPPQAAPGAPAAVDLKVPNKKGRSSSA